MGDFEKFAWINAVRDDERLAHGVKYVLQNVAWTYVLTAGEGELYAKQTTVAERLKVSVRQVKSAYATARNLGYFALVDQRQRGRGHYGPDRYVLQLPQAIGAPSAPIEGEIGARNDVNRCTDRPKKVHETTEIGARTEALTSENDVPKGIKQVIKKGEEGGTADAAPPSSSILEDNKRPSRYCIWHQPDGTNEPCRECQEARHRQEAWDAANAPPSPPRTKPLNHDDVPHPETWADWAAENRISVERPERSCKKYPNCSEHCGACISFKKRFESWETERELWREWNDVCRKNIQDCTRCDNQGLINNPYDGLMWCEHDLDEDQDQFFDQLTTTQRRESTR